MAPSGAMFYETPRKVTNSRQSVEENS